MDTHFLEFLGNFLIQTAKGQRQVEDMTGWIREGFKGPPDLTAMFQQFYGLDGVNKDSVEFPKMQQKASEDFQKSLKDYLSIFALVPRDEYLALVERYEVLKEKAEAQEETIKHLRTLLAAKISDPGNVAKGFQDLMKEQSEQFQKLMESFGESFHKKSS